MGPKFYLENLKAGVHLRDLYMCILPVSPDVLPYVPSTSITWCIAICAFYQYPMMYCQFNKFVCHFLFLAELLCRCKARSSLV